MARWARSSAAGWDLYSSTTLVDLSKTRCGYSECGREGCPSMAGFWVCCSHFFSIPATSKKITGAPSISLHRWCLLDSEPGGSEISSAVNCGAGQRMLPGVWCFPMLINYPGTHRNCMRLPWKALLCLFSFGFFPLNHGPVLRFRACLPSVTAVSDFSSNFFVSRIRIWVISLSTGSRWASCCRHP